MTFQGPLPKVPPHGRIKPKYNPQPNSGEREHKAYVKEQPCYGCGIHGQSEAHHIMLDCPGKRWKRRDHRFLVPLCPDCHRGPEGVHGVGCEAKWCERNGKDTAAEAVRLEAESVAMGILPEKEDA
ncbi:hypothetical protein [Pelagerythrobacter marinus]|uniref:hypothetical protein n=1 Tax=Pelagerythrobacter marinus TaxID=538382 RepID=UPI001368AD7F|nr:hypothetical protein [Pelagerythrobacter marinus]